MPREWHDSMCVSNPKWLTSATPRPDPSSIRCTLGCSCERHAQAPQKHRNFLCRFQSTCRAGERSETRDSPCMDRAKGNQAETSQPLISHHPSAFKPFEGREIVWWGLIGAKKLRSDCSPAKDPPKIPPSILQVAS